jgi:hypothetical protein
VSHWAFSGANGWYILFFDRKFLPLISLTLLGEAAYFIKVDSFIDVKDAGDKLIADFIDSSRGFLNKLLGVKIPEQRKFSEDFPIKLFLLSVNYFNALQLSFQAESPTNHATVLSILALKQQQQQQQRGVGGEEGAIPPACCVPRKMDSLTVLYFDNDGSVVLKTYPQMSVQSCGCR